VTQAELAISASPRRPTARLGPNVSRPPLGVAVDAKPRNRLLVKLLYKGAFVLRAGLPHEIGRSDEAISRLQQHEADLKRLGVEQLYMFGSTARGEAKDFRR
jgi:hypothetical protein